MIVMPINEESLIVKFDDIISNDIHMKVKYYSEVILKDKEVLSISSGYNSILVTYDYRKYDYKDFEEMILAINYEKDIKKTIKKIVHIPVCYDDEFALDIKRVAKFNNIEVEEVISKHLQPEYLVYMIGFTPGFPYLGGMNQDIKTPRLDSPRLKIDAGSVGIGGNQTGIYPASTPGGWNIIGKTPLTLFDINNDKASLLEMGDYVKFERISSEDFIKINKLIESHEYVVKVEVVS